MMFSTFLIKNWQYVVIAILIASNTFTVNLYLSSRDQLTVCTTNYKNKEAEVISCNSLIGEQNTAIGEWEAKGKALETRVRELTDDVSIIEAKYSGAIQAINDMKVPETCDGSMKWLVDQGSKL